jgi:hypothetical protein
MIQPPPQACVGRYMSTGYCLFWQLFTNVVTDVLITISIAYGLWKSKTGWKDTDNLLKRIIA